MTPEQQRIAIAKACGWKFCDRVTDKKSGVAWNVYELNGKRASIVTNTLPDYLNDLNAMHDAEKVIVNTDPELRSRWFIWMQANTNFAGIHATAPQRAEAFLRAIGKWAE